MKPPNSGFDIPARLLLWRLIDQLQDFWGFQWLNLSAEILIPINAFDFENFRRQYYFDKSNLSFINLLKIFTEGYKN